VKKKIPTLTTERLVMRPWDLDDIDTLRDILADPEVTHYLFGAIAVAPTDARAVYQRRVETWETDGMGFWPLALKETGEMIGWTGLQRVKFEKGVIGEVELGWTLGRQWWGQGLAHEAAVAAMDWGFEKRDLARIFAFCHPDNLRSEKLMCRLGMQGAGTTEDIRDRTLSKLYMLTRESWLALRQDAPHGLES
jgi:RimJ/RimL family protein N-acetyltransferase